MTDIRDEKPNWKQGIDEVGFVPDHYIKSEMDAWLEKLGAEIDNKDEIITRLLRNTVLLKEKLEAVKTHIESESLSKYGLDLCKFARADINTQDFHYFIIDLMKIVGGSEFKENSEE